MELITWNDSLATGISIIDAQHKVLINKLNKLNSSIKALNDSGLNILLDELLEYTFYHFETEENYFEEFDYEGKEAHLKEHDEFRKYLRTFLKTEVRNDSNTQNELLNFLKKWVEHHIKDIDMMYVDFLKEKIK